MDGLLNCTESSTLFNNRVQFIYETDRGWQIGGLCFSEPAVLRHCLYPSSYVKYSLSCYKYQFCCHLGCYIYDSRRRPFPTWILKEMGLRGQFGTKTECNKHCLLAMVYLKNGAPQSILVVFLFVESLVTNVNNVPIKCQFLNVTHLSQCFTTPIPVRALSYTGQKAVALMTQVELLSHAHHRSHF